MKTSALTKIVGSAAFALVATVSMAANAGTYDETLVSTSAEGLRTITVPYEDLDLSNATGQETLAARISTAARRVCGTTDYREAGSLRQASDNKVCYQNAMAQAMSATLAPQFAVIER